MILKLVFALFWCTASLVVSLMQSFNYCTCQSPQQKMFFVSKKHSCTCWNFFVTILCDLNSGFCLVKIFVLAVIALFHIAPKGKNKMKWPSISNWKLYFCSQLFFSYTAPLFPLSSHLPISLSLVSLLFLLSSASKHLNIWLCHYVSCMKCEDIFAWGMAYLLYDWHNL